MKRLGVSKYKLSSDDVMWGSQQSHIYLRKLSRGCVHAHVVLHFAFPEQSAALSDWVKESATVLKIDTQYLL